MCAELLASVPALFVTRKLEFVYGVLVGCAF